MGPGLQIDMDNAWPGQPGAMGNTGLGLPVAVQGNREWVRQNSQAAVIVQ